MKRIREEKGQTQLEYILLISVVIVILSLGIPPMREAVANVITRAIQAFSRNDEVSEPPAGNDVFRFDYKQSLL
ncbi:MAG TPA: hypothetical protein PK581_07990 [Caldisericia bacterium]|nr:hypothetical protein [Caldisericia bacterium]